MSCFFFLIFHMTVDYMDNDDWRPPLLGAYFNASIPPRMEQLVL